VTVRFRFTEDERRYMLLLAENYRLMAQHLPAQVVSHMMRNFGKLEQIAWLEGVRQGVACAAVSNVSRMNGQEGLEHLKAFQLHAHVYGSCDTPLRDAEVEWMGKMMTDAEHGAGAWLDSKPMRFAPTTLEEWAQGMQPAQPAAPGPAPTFVTQDPLAEASSLLGAYDEGRAIPLEWPNDASGNPAPGEMPAMLDGLRDQLQQLVASGEQIASWQDMIMKLHVATGTDAAFLDLQLSSEMGRAVLDQAGLINLHPGGAFNMTTFLTHQEMMEKLRGRGVPVGPADEGDGDGGEASPQNPPGE
jgi:hypothetical protein